jgi:hypothetical protein
MLMVGTFGGDGARRLTAVPLVPPKKKNTKKQKDQARPAWFANNFPPRRVRAVHSFVTTDDDDDF